MRQNKPAGCLGMLVFFVAELGALAGTVYLGHMLLAPLLRGLVPAGESDFADVLAIVIALIAACVPVFLIDRLCKRVTGHSVLDSMPLIP